MMLCLSSLVTSLIDGMSGMSASVKSRGAARVHTLGLLPLPLPPRSLAYREVQVLHRWDDLVCYRSRFATVAEVLIPHKWDRTMRGGQNCQIDRFTAKDTIPHAGDGQTVRSIDSLVNIVCVTVI